MGEGDTNGAFGKIPQNWNGISRFVKQSDVSKKSLTREIMFYFCGGLPKVPLASPSVHFSLTKRFIGEKGPFIKINHWGKMSTHNIVSNILC